MHNGSIPTLREVIDFYNRRDVEPHRWGQTDYPATVNRDDLGDLGLNDQEVSDLTALMDAFTDRTLLRLQPGQLTPDALPRTRTRQQLRRAFPGWTHRLHPAFPVVVNEE